jgi:hypothetical protein
MRSIPETNKEKQKVRVIQYTKTVSFPSLLGVKSVYLSLDMSTVMHVVLSLFTLHTRFYYFRNCRLQFTTL